MYFCWNCDEEFETYRSGANGQALCPCCGSEDIEDEIQCSRCKGWFQSTKLRDCGKAELCADCLNEVKDIFIRSISKAERELINGTIDSLDAREAYFDIVQCVMES